MLNLNTGGHKLVVQVQNWNGFTVYHVVCTECRVVQDVYDPEFIGKLELPCHERMIKTLME